MNIRQIVKNHPFLYSIANRLLRLKTRLFGGGRIKNKGKGHLKKNIIGSYNVIEIGEGTIITGGSVYIRGNNNRLVIGSNCKIKKNCSFWMIGNNCSIILGNNVTMQHNNHFNVREDGRSIVIGSDCMLSNNIIVRTSDDHGIFDMETKQRLNPSKDVHIGNHVWIAPHSRIMKGADVGDGVVVGSNTMISKRVPENVLVVGMPAKIVKTNILWSKSVEKIII